MRHSTPAREKASVLLLLALLSVIFIFGGSNRGDVIEQTFVRLGAIIIGGMALLPVNALNLRPLKTLLLFVLAYLALALIQLLPLPPAIWTALPMRQIFAETATVVGMPQPWRPISLVPEATINSALACLPLLSTLLCMMMVRTKHWPVVIAVVAGFTMLSGVMGLIQMTSGRLYLYTGSHEGAVGLLANRNHQAALLATAIPAIAVLAIVGPKQVDIFWRNAVALAVVLFVIPLCFVTGSRAGILLMLVGLTGAVTLSLTSRKFSAPTRPSKFSSRRVGRRSRLGWAFGGIAVICSVGSTIFLARAVAVQRLLAKDIEGDLRLVLFEPMLNIVTAAFPFGTGLGSFASIFKVYEPDWNLRPTYFNHAHNDVMEIAIESGLFGLLLIVGFLVWWGMAALRVWRAPAREPRVIIARLGTIQTFIFMLASLVDYPLRVPIGQLVFSLGCCFMAITAHREARHQVERNALDAKPVSR